MKRDMVNLLLGLIYKLNVFIVYMWGENSIYRVQCYLQFQASGSWNISSVDKGDYSISKGETRFPDLREESCRRERGVKDSSNTVELGS